MAYDVILGRQFFVNSKLKLIYSNGEFSFETTEADINNVESILAINAVEEKEKFDSVIENLDPKLNIVARKNLLNVLQELEAKEIAPINDDYCVRVHLKDTSLFRYAPKRLSFVEKIELDEIIDDLLKRKIIKPSISPYCARVIMINKRNGKKRMCVDLRPLNQRISPQKFPIPEDQLDKLYNKKWFTKLDLKDSFHQISIHPENTKYFAFATHSGQYEYVKLPFGYSEAPAEFQKRILSVFQPLIRSGKILTYIDDILIATKTVAENLEILGEVLNIMKQYSFELNWSKCRFLRSEIEYLGYLV